MKHTIKPNTKQLKIMKKYWEYLERMTNDYHNNVNLLEGSLRYNTKICDIEFFRSDDGCVGIGNANRTMKLWQPRRAIR